MPGKITTPLKRYWGLAKPHACGLSLGSVTRYHSRAVRGLVAGNQAFIFDGTSAVVAAGHLSFSVSGTTATVKAYVDAGTAVDFQITLTHLTTLTADDFML
jgi:hypothetical protein